LWRYFTVSLDAHELAAERSRKSAKMLVPGLRMRRRKENRAQDVGQLTWSLHGGRGWAPIMEEAAWSRRAERRGIGVAQSEWTRGRALGV